MFEKDFEMLKMIRMEMVTDSFAESLPFKTSEFKEEVQPLVDELLKYRRGDCADTCDHYCVDANECECRDEDGEYKCKSEGVADKLEEAEDLIETLKDQIFELNEEVKALQNDMFN